MLILTKVRKKEKLVLFCIIFYCRSYFGELPYSFEMMNVFMYSNSRYTYVLLHVCTLYIHPDTSRCMYIVHTYIIHTHICMYVFIAPFVFAVFSFLPISRYKLFINEHGLIFGGIMKNSRNL